MTRGDVFTLRDAQAPALESPAEASEQSGLRFVRLLPYFVLGIYLGVVFIKSEVISWFRIQEMFRFQSFHMYGVIAGAVTVAPVAGAHPAAGPAVSERPRDSIPPKGMNGPGYRYWIGGILFGVGWARLGACPGPIFTLIGNGVTVVVAGARERLDGNLGVRISAPSAPALT